MTRSRQRGFVPAAAYGSICLGWYLFGVAFLLTLFGQANDCGDVSDTAAIRNLLSAAGWCVSGGWALRWSVTRTGRRPRINWFRLFCRLNLLEAYAAPLTRRFAALSATPARRICLAVVLGFALLSGVSIVFGAL